ncbi:hypothetical protein [Halobacillus amylolyticus]|uniref:YfhE family protein n=1 Tax=Halobacillus amylolyticus TaxID=2932259 RepID=A0ABY4HGQ6_9BACI|nr:hypothetical protein [Halobacillus amylolyticus]UOR13847.1 hypothetical protein MUO15_10600 [Halobacillus amylolyticus]
MAKNRRKKFETNVNELYQPSSKYYEKEEQQRLNTTEDKVMRDDFTNKK